MQTCDLLIKDGSLLIKYDQLEEHVDMAVSGGRILETGKELWKKYQAVETINGKGKLFMPGLIDSHMHTGQQLLKGLVLDAKPIIWTRIMLPFESTLTPDKMRLCAQAATIWRQRLLSTRKAAFAAHCPIPPWMRRGCRSP